MFGTRSKNKINDDVLGKYVSERKSKTVEKSVKSDKEKRSRSSDSETKHKNQTPVASPRKELSRVTSSPNLEIREESKGTNTEEPFDDSCLNIETTYIDFSNSGNVTEKFVESLESVQSEINNETIAGTSSAGIVSSTLNEKYLINSSEIKEGTNQTHKSLNLESLAQKSFARNVRYVPQGRPSLKLWPKVFSSKRKSVLINSLKQKSNSKIAEGLSKSHKESSKQSLKPSKDKLTNNKVTENNCGKLKPKKLFENSLNIMDKDEDGNSGNESDKKKDKMYGKRNSLPTVGSSGIGNLRDALKLIPEFDGKRESLNRYIAGLQDALEIVGPNLEDHLLKLSKTKLTPSVWNKISKNTFDGIDEYIEYLQITYDPPRDIYQLTGELGSAFQKQKESIDEFSHRIQELAEKILEAFYHKEGYLNQDERNRVEKMALGCFVKGIKLKYRQEVKDFKSLRDAIAHAKTVERELDDYERLRETEVLKLKSEKPEKKASINYIEPGKTEVIKDTEVQGKLICQLCGKIGHTADRCRSSPNKINASTTVTCQLCKKLGHSADKCLTLSSVQQAKEPLICKHCGRTGHTVERCFRIPGATPPEGLTICQICGKRGHVAEKCYSRQQSSEQRGFVNSQGLQPIQQNNGYKQGLQCYECQGWGHLSRNCGNKRNFGNQGTQGQGYRQTNSNTIPMQGNGNGLPVSGGQTGGLSNVHPTLIVNSTQK